MIHLFFPSVILVSAFSRKHRIFFDLALLMLFGFAALRYGYGNDYFSYSRCFAEIRLMNANPFPGEWLFTALNRILPHYHWLIAITSLAFVCAIGCLIQRNVPAPYQWFSFLLLLINPYLFLMHLSAIRQCMALVCFVFAIPFARRRKPIPYVLLCLMACGFHNSAVILLPAYFIANDRRVSRLSMLLTAAGVLILLGWGDALPTVLSKVLGWLQLPRYQSVLDEGVQNSLRATILSSVPFLYLIWRLPNLRGTTLVYAKLWLVGALMSVLAFRLSKLTRPEMYFDLFCIVAFPRMLAQPHKGSTLSQALLNWLLPGLIVLILLLRYYSFFTNPMWTSFFTYQTILQP